MAIPQGPVGVMVDTCPAIRVGPARHGLGVFAERAIVEDEIIGEVTGTIVHQTGYGSEYCIDLDPGRALEPDAPFRYVNHSCDPNCEIFSWDETEGDVTPDQVFLVALRVIQPVGPVPPFGQVIVDSKIISFASRIHEPKDRQDRTDR